MPRRLTILVVLGLGVGCGSRAASLPDSLAVAEAGAHRDGSAPDRQVQGPDASPTTCSSLSLVGQASLEVADTLKLGPQIAFDGERFALIWHSQPGVVSSLNGELRFALVDGAGKTDRVDGIPLTDLGTDDGGFRASILPSPTHHGQYMLLNRQPSPTACVNASRIDAAGKGLWGI